jgi:hypothetical protein
LTSCKVREIQELRVGGLVRMTERVSTIPVPAGGYELNQQGPFTYLLPPHELFTEAWTASRI